MAAPPARYVKTVDGVDIACFVAGAGPTLVRTPLFFSHISRQWIPEWSGPDFDAFASRFKLVMYDGRGQGLSSRGLPESLKLDDLLLDLESVVENAGGSEVTLLCESWSGLVGIRYAVEHPDRVRALILWNYYDIHTRTHAIHLQMAATDWLLHVESGGRTVFPDKDPNIVVPILYDSMTQSDHFRFGEAIHRASGTELLAKVDVPTLVLAHRSGQRPFAMEDPAKQWASMLPHAKLVLLDGNRAYGHARDGIPEGVLAISDFLASLPGGEGSTRRVKGSLSAREMEVLQLIAAGKSNPQIAEELVISASTVAKHVSSILGKTGAANRVEVTSYAHRHHIV